MMTPTPDKVAAIVRGLTKAQRRALLWLPADGSAAVWPKGSEVSLYIMSKVVSGDPEKSVALTYSLCKQAGRTGPTPTSRWGSTLWRATPLGLAVRAALTNTGDDDAGR